VTVTTPTTRSREVAAAARRVVMAAAKAARATSVAAEVTVSVSRPGAGGVAMSMQIGSK
jgi:hypothetical protein